MFTEHVPRMHFRLDVESHKLPKQQKELFKFMKKTVDVLVKA
jgi:hypothetical protein